MIYEIYFKNFGEGKAYVPYTVEIGDETYVFTVQWVGDDFTGFATLNITDYDDNEIVASTALVNNLRIRNSKLPYTLYFVHINDETYEPTLDNLADEFCLTYDDEETE